jgi:hypothetical protein
MEQVREKSPRRVDGGICRLIPPTARQFMIETEYRSGYVSNIVIDHARDRGIDFAIIAGPCVDPRKIISDLLPGFQIFAVCEMDWH